MTINDIEPRPGLALFETMATAESQLLAYIGYEHPDSSPYAFFGYTEYVWKLNGTDCGDEVLYTQYAHDTEEELEADNDLCSLELWGNDSVKRVYRKDDIVVVIATDGNGSGPFFAVFDATLEFQEKSE